VCSSVSLLVGLFNSIRCSGFLSAPRTFDVYALLTDGQGRMDLDVTVTDLSTDEQDDARSMEGFFSDALFRLHVRFRFATLSFPAPGHYLFELLADGQPTCHCRLHGRLSEE
jgi:hypothetical protein